MAVGEYLEKFNLGHAIVGNSGIVTERNPDSVRSADFAFYTYSKIPKRSIPDGYATEPADFVIDVRAPDESWLDVHAKVADFLRFNVPTVCVFDADTTGAHLYHADAPPKILGPDDELTFPECLHGFSVPVRRFFE